jgi:hypothetical protein
VARALLQLTTSAAAYTYTATSLGAALGLSISGTSGATFTLNVALQADLNSKTSFGMSGLPDGFTAVSSYTVAQAAIGYQLSVTGGSSTSIGFTLTTPAITNAATLLAQGNLGVLHYNVEAQTYTRIPANQITANGNNQLSISYDQPGYFCK